MAAPFSQSIEHPELEQPAWSVPFGPYFAFCDADLGDDRAWVSVADLLASDELILERIRHAAATMGAETRDRRTLRAAASTMALGLFARLLSPAVGAALLHERAPAADPATLWLLTVASGPIPLATSNFAAADPHRAVTDVAMPLADGVQRATGLSEHVLLGNIAAGVVGACQVVGMIRPDLGPAAEDLRADLLSSSPLRGTGTGRGPFTRTSCCLIYQLPMGYICSNCVLVASQTRMVRERDNEVAGSPGFRYIGR